MDTISIAASDKLANDINAVFSSGEMPLIDLCNLCDRLIDGPLVRLGGSTDSEEAVLTWLLKIIGGRIADSAEAAAWRGRLLARAVDNGWDEAEIKLIAKQVREDAEHLGLAPA